MEDAWTAPSPEDAARAARNAALYLALQFYKEVSNDYDTKHTPKDMITTAKTFLNYINSPE